MRDRTTTTHACRHWALAAIAVLLFDTTARAQHYDHLHCYRVKDEANFAATVTLDALLAQFGSAECQVKGRGKLYCVAVDKTVDSFTDKSKTGIPPTGYVGEETSDGRLCYKVKCPAVELPSQQVSDQFGTRQVSKLKSQLLCTPAVAGVPPPPTTTTLPPLPLCSGGSGWPLCGGDCSGVGPTHLCEGRDDMTCACVLPCGDLDPGAGDFCVQGGGCPVDSACSELAGVCTCLFSP